MKKIILSLSLFAALAAVAQNKDEIAVLANARALHNSVFGNKDSTILDKLFAKEISYGHSGGKIENRQEAIFNISRNLSTYSDLAMGPTSIWIEKNTAITRHTMTANELTKDGKTNPLKLHILLVWIKEKKAWVLIARQAVKLP